VSTPRSQKLVLDPDGRPWIVSGNPERGYISQPTVSLPGTWHRRSWQATQTVNTPNAAVGGFIGLAQIIERALDDAIAAGVAPADTEMLADHVADVFMSLPALHSDWEAQ
jgi:hypothetical protein